MQSLCCGCWRGPRRTGILVGRASQKFGETGLASNVSEARVCRVDVGHAVEVEFGVHVVVVLSVVLVRREISAELEIVGAFDPAEVIGVGKGVVDFSGGALRAEARGESRAEVEEAAGAAGEVGSVA